MRDTARQGIGDNKKARGRAMVAPTLYARGFRAKHSRAFVMTQVQLL